MPDFATWQKFVKEEKVPIMKDKLLDIPSDKLGILRQNTKFAFPSDNSIIRIDKYNVGQRVMGESYMIKDNFVFGISEKISAFEDKVEGIETLRNRDAKQLQDKRCDFWLIFENGVRLTI